MRLLPLLLAAVLGCSRPQELRPEPPSPSPAARPLPLASASAAPSPPPPFSVPAAKAKALVEALPEVKDLARLLTYTDAGERKIRPTAWVRREAEPTCAEGACKHEVEAGDEEDPRDREGRLSFAVDAFSGKIEVRHADSKGDPPALVPYEEWSALQRRRERYLELLFSLPEVRAYDAMLRRLSRGKVWMTVRIEETPRLGCKQGDDDCFWQYYVGERHEDHTVRGHTFRIEDTSARIERIGLDGTHHPVTPPRPPASPRK